MLAHKTYKNKIICQPQCLYRLGPEERQTEKRKQANGNNQQEQEPQAATLTSFIPLPLAGLFLAFLVDQVIQGVIFVKDVVMAIMHGRLLLLDELIQRFPGCRLITLAILYFPDREFLT